MSNRLSPEVERELADLMAEVGRESPALAERVGTVVGRIVGPEPDQADFISTGEAAAALGVSPNTVKKWVRQGYIRDFWTLPGSGYIKIARAEIARIRAEGAPGVGRPR
jgi:excisionase family DNA binding protein